MPYVVESTDGKPLSALAELAGFLLGHYSGLGTAYTALRLGAPVVRSTLGAVAAPRVLQGGTAMHVLLARLQAQRAAAATRPAPVSAPKPSINVVRQVSTTQPVLKLAPDPGNNVAPTTTAPSFQLVAPTGSRNDPYNTGLPYQYGQPAGSGPSPIPGAPEVEIGTLPAPGSVSLAGLTSNPLLLGGIALAAFMFLGDSKPKRRRR